MTVTLEEAQAHFGDLISKLQLGDPIVITADDKPIAQFVPPVPDKPRPQFGRSKGMLTIIAEDDEHLSDFAEYMPQKEA